MRRISRKLALLLALIWPSALHAAEPKLAVYVTDQNQDVFVALYEGAAIELTGCANAAAAREILQLPADAALRESTLAELTTVFQLRAQPKIPCGGQARFDADWPATSPVWADLEASGRYYLRAPEGGETFFAIPAACNGIKAALAIRERLQLPGVLQGMNAPPGLERQIVLECGSLAQGDTPRPDDAGAPAVWSLHVFDTFLSPESTGDRIFVARYARGEGGAGQAVYLPIWRLDGKPASEIALTGGAIAEHETAALKALFAIAPDAPITVLGAEAVAPIQSAVHVDLCLDACEGYPHQHAVFASPGVDLGLTPLAEKLVRTGIDALGQEQFSWEFAPGRRAVFIGCSRLAQALGLNPEQAPGWNDLVEGAIAAAELTAPGYDCSGSGTDLCIRRVANGGPLTGALAAAGSDCPGASRLRIELPAAVNLPNALVLAGTTFREITIAPVPGVARSSITGLPSLPQMPASGCLLSPAKTLIATNGLPRLILSRLDLRRSAVAGPGEAVALQAERGTLALDDVTIGGEGEGLLPVERAVSLCQSDLYAARSRIAAEALAVQAITSRLLLSGTETAHSMIAGKRFGLLLSSESALRLHYAEIVAPTSLVLRSATLRASRSALSSGQAGLSDGHALRLERGSAASLATSTARGFRCVGTFVDANASVTFVLPGNDLAADNSHISCGANKVSVLE